MCALGNDFGGFDCVVCGVVLHILCLIWVGDTVVIVIWCGFVVWVLGGGFVCVVWFCCVFLFVVRLMDVVSRGFVIACFRGSCGFKAFQVW